MDQSGFLLSLMQSCFDQGVAAVRASNAMPAVWFKQLEPWLANMAPERKCIWVIGAGKASAPMARALEVCVAGREHLTGLVITREGHRENTEFIRVLEAAHPVPNEEGLRAARRLLKMVQEVPSTDPVIALISGGGSSLLSVPVPEIPFVDLQRLNRALLTCGAPIDEINVVRKHVTQTLGGQLAQACKAPVFQVLVSDVPGDDPSSIASGPFAPDESSFQDAVEVLKRWSVQVPHSVVRHLDRGCRGLLADTPNSSSLVFRKVKSHLMASNAVMLNAVEKRLIEQGYRVLSLGDGVEGEARHVAKVHAAMVRQVLAGASGWPGPPLAILSGGECSVTMSEAQMKQSKGGRNSEFLLALAHELRHLDCATPMAAMAADTDGLDGVGGHAGAFWLLGDQVLAQTKRLSAQLHLDQHASYSYFKAMDRLLMTGPTKTNVNDLRLILIGLPSSVSPQPAS